MDNFQEKCRCNKGVNCAVCNCYYHDGNCSCTASKISIGPSTADSCRETVCATFKKRDEDSVG